MGLLQANTPGDRKEIRDMLSALSPMDRLRFVCDCLVRVDKTLYPVLSGYPVNAARHCDRADSRVTAAAYCDLIYLAAQHGMDLDETIDRLAEYVSRPSALRENPSIRRLLADARGSDLVPRQ
jgi:hypothetical protein